MESISIGSAAIKLTDKILGYNSDDLADILKAIASEIGLLHIAHLRFATDQSSDASLLTAVVTYSREWQARYFLKQYLTIDPVVRHGRTALLPFDWETIAEDFRKSGFLRRRRAPQTWAQRSVHPRSKSQERVFSRIVHQRHSQAGMGVVQKKQHDKSPAFVGPYRLGCQHELQSASAGRPFVPARGAMSHLGGKRQNASGHSRDFGPGSGQREDAPGYCAPQATLHKPDPRSGRCGGDRGNPGGGSARQYLSGFRSRLRLGLRALRNQFAGAGAVRVEVFSAAVQLVSCGAHRLRSRVRKGFNDSLSVVFRAPVRAIQKVGLTEPRLAWPRRFGSPEFPGRRGAIRSHCASLRTR